MEAIKDILIVRLPILEWGLPTSEDYDRIKEMAINDTGNQYHVIVVTSGNNSKVEFELLRNDEMLDNIDELKDKIIELYESNNK